MAQGRGEGEVNEAQLYVIAEGANGPLKIGRSVSAKNRLASLQTGNPRSLMLVGWITMSAADVIRAEQELHEELEPYALVGEWFDLKVDYIVGFLPNFFITRGFGVLW
jgi:hypothetical protein